MKLIELAQQHDLDMELLVEVCEEDLSIGLPDKDQTELDDAAVRRILACDGLETTDGEAFEPIIDQEYIEKTKRSQAAKKAAQTRKRKEEAAKAKERQEEEERIAEERAKHEEALRIREAEEEAKQQAEEEARAKAEQTEDLRRKAEEEARQQAEEEAQRRAEQTAALNEKIAKGLAAEADAKAEAESAEAQAAAEAAAQAEAEAAAAAEAAAEPEAAPEAEPTPEPEAPAPAAEAPAKAPEPAAAPAASQPAAKAEPAKPAAAAESKPKQQRSSRKVEATQEAKPAKAEQAGKAEKKPEPAVEPSIPKATKGMGGKLASLAKATAEKSDHSTKDKNVKDLETVAITKVNPTGSPADETLSEEDRRRLIQENIRKNLAIQQRVKEAKLRSTRSFKTIDRRGKGPGGGGGGGGRGGANQGGPGMPPAGGPGGPGGRGAGRGGGSGRGRDNRDHRLERSESDGNNRGRGRRRPLSSEEEDLSGIKEFTVQLPCTVRDFSANSGIKVNVVIAKLLGLGVMSNINSTMDKDQIELLASEFDKEVVIKEAADVEEEVEALHDEDDNEDDLAPRPPIVTVLGHVDHGKTSLLDYIRKTELTSDEAGGITQHIGAYTVHAKDGMEVTFIDTPGHEAFTAMRARGAQVTDVAIIVVAADDGIMPQTIEAINHAKAAGVAIVVAMNKMDKEGADKDKVLRQLADQGILAEEWGGEFAVVPCSAITGQGVDDLLDRLVLEAEVLELKANHFAKASGTVIEANLSEGRGVTATLLVQRGSLCQGDVILAGTGYGRVRNLVDWKGDTTKVAGPSTAVEIIGLSELPSAGSRFHVVENLRLAAEAAEQRSNQQREKELAARNTTTSLATLFKTIEDNQKQEVRLIVKADAAGSLEVLRKSLDDLATDEVRINLVHSGVGAISTGDITLAEASNAVVIGFHVVADTKARRMADDKNIQLSSYTIIYELLDDVRRAMEGMLAPEEVEKVIGHAMVLQTFRSSKFGTIAGLQVSDGIVQRGCYLRITRDGVILHEGKVNTLRRFKEDVREVREGYECGITIEKWNDIQPDDTFEFYARESVARSL